jgi:hypothetical protein
MSKLSTYFAHVSDIFYDSLRRKLTYLADMGKVAYADLWEARQL